MTLVGNSEGDGEYWVRVMDKAQFRIVEGEYVFATVVQGKAVTIFDYDCQGAEPLCTMAGRFAVYRRRRSGDMAVVVWEDWTKEAE
jgi:hypothetical protein